MDLDVKKHYPKDWVVLQNRVVECFKSMTLDEKRLFIMATPLARTTNISSGEPIFISTEEFASACGLEITGAYTALGIATKKLFDRYFGYVRADKRKLVFDGCIKQLMARAVQSYISLMKCYCCLEFDA